MAPDILTTESSSVLKLIFSLIHGIAQAIIISTKTQHNNCGEIAFIIINISQAL